MPGLPRAERPHLLEHGLVEALERTVLLGAGIGLACRPIGLVAEQDADDLEIPRIFLQMGDRGAMAD